MSLEDFKTFSPPTSEPTHSICCFINIINVVKLQALKLRGFSSDWHCVSADGSVLGNSEWFQIHFVSGMMKMAARLLKMYICKHDYGVCVQINEAKTMTHNQHFISQEKATDRLISALQTHAHTHMYMQRTFGIIDICDTLDKILSGNILYPNEQQKAEIPPYNLLLICVWCLMSQH